MRNSTIPLYGFEEGLAAVIAAGFRFANPGYNDLVLEGARHIHVSTMPDPADIARTIAFARETDPSIKPYDSSREPMIGIGCATGEGVPATSSSSQKEEWNIQAVMRFGKAPEVVKGLLEELAAWLLKRRGRVPTGYQIKGTKMLSRPTVLGVDQNDLCLVSTTIKFFVVPLPR